VFGIVPLNGGVASIRTMFLGPGTNIVQAAYAGNGNYAASTNSLQQVVVAVCSSTNYILSVVKNETNTLTFTFIGTTNAQYSVLRTTDLSASVTNWTALPGSTNTAYDGVWNYTVTNDGGPAFFRVQAIAPCQ
jgi:hypothetical protein